MVDSILKSNVIVNHFFKQSCYRFLSLRLISSSIKAWALRRPFVKILTGLLLPLTSYCKGWSLPFFPKIVMIKPDSGDKK